MPTWQGKKAGGSHTTLIGAAISLVRKAEKIHEVRRILLGYIKPTPGKTGPRRVKFKIMKGGLLLVVRGNAAVQEVRIYTKFPEIVQQQLKKVRL